MKNCDSLFVMMYVFGVYLYSDFCLDLGPSSLDLLLCARLRMASITIARRAKVGGGVIELLVSSMHMAIPSGVGFA